MTTKHRKITERHIIVDVLAVTLGGFVVDTVTHRSWISGLVSTVLTGALYVFDKIGIENEERTDV